MLPSAVQDLARFFLSLSGSSSLGAVGSVAGMAASASGSGVQLCPSTGAVALGAATAIPTGAGVLPAASTAVPGVSGEQQLQEDSRSRRRRRRSSSDGTDRRSKKRSRRRSPSPVPSFRCWEKHYRASSDSSEVDRADASPPRTGRAPGGTLGDSRSSRVMTVRRVLGHHGRLREASVIIQALVVDPLLLRERRMTTGRVPSNRLILNMMTLSGKSWASSGAFTAWKSLQVLHQLVARLILLQLMV